jgi:SAM-dependent methyltransferase
VVVAFVTVGVLGAALWAAGALRAVDAVEAERDRWQRPADVIRALDVGEGAVVADLGSGVGYFALKLAGRVGPNGRVLAVDVRSFPLLFLRLRGLVRGCSSLTVVRGEAGDPHLPAGRLDAILVANTFHELEDPDEVLGHAREALRPGGRLVVVDPGADVADAGPPRHGNHRHASPDEAEGRILRAGLEIVSRDDAFVDEPGRGRWWLIVARRSAAVAGDLRFRDDQARQGLQVLDAALMRLLIPS